MNTTQAPTHPLIRMRGTATIREAAQLMCDLGIGAIGIDDGRHNFVGLFTERDLMFAVAGGKVPSQTPVSDVANDFPIIVDGPISSLDGAKRMQAGHVRHLLIVDEGELRILCLRDVVRDEFAASGDGSTPSPSSSRTELRRMFGTE